MRTFKIQFIRTLRYKKRSKRKVNFKTTHSEREKNQEKTTTKIAPNVGQLCTKTRAFCLELKVSE